MKYLVVKIVHVGEPFLHLHHLRFQVTFPQQQMVEVSRKRQNERKGKSRNKKA